MYTNLMISYIPCSLMKFKLYSQKINQVRQTGRPGRSRWIGEGRTTTPLLKGEEEENR
jgi:hypothetical protein